MKTLKGTAICLARFVGDQAESNSLEAISDWAAEPGYKAIQIPTWGTALKHPQQGAREGAPITADHIIQVTDKAFDDFAGGKTDLAANERILGLGRQTGNRPMHHSLRTGERP